MSNIITLTFQKTTFDVVDRDGDAWLRSPQIAVALGYSRADRVNELYARNADEFTADMTELVKLPTAGGEQDVRIFSPRGCYALAMFARTKVAKEFRRWVLDVLESIRKTGKYETTVTPEQQSALQAIVATISPDGKQRGMIWARFNRHFKIAKYNQLPVSQIDEAKQYLIDTFLEGEYIEQAELDMQAYVAAHQVSIVDIKAQLKLGLSEPTLPLTDKLRKAIHTKSFEITGDCYHAITDHLERRIAFNCEVGSPRYLDEQRALKLVENTTLDSALTHHFYGLLENVHSMAQSLTMMTEAYKRDVGKALGKPQLLAA